ncbi:MAG: aquaporin [Verrucomicrobia bacterium]|nr:aquaporin [Verrucomicrobiota bacterium]
MPGRKPLVAEFLGTFTLVFAGTGSAIVNDTNNGVVTLVGIALAFGLIVLSMIYAIGDVSGAHINPAVSFGLCLAKRFPWSSLAPYVIAQCLGALAASAALHWFFPAHETLGATLPSGSPQQSFAIEVILTAFLVFVVLNVTQGGRDRGITAGVVIGAVITWEVLLGGPVSGASMNPARSLGPAVVSGKLEHLWIYLTATFAGAALGVAACHLIRSPETAPAAAAPSAPAPKNRPRRR